MVSFLMKKIKNFCCILTKSVYNNFKVLGTLSVAYELSFVAILNEILIRTPLINGS